jgi:hypothetical protein
MDLIERAELSIGRIAQGSAAPITPKCTPPIR